MDLINHLCQIFPSAVTAAAIWPKPKGIITGIFEGSMKKKNQDISEETKQLLGFSNKDVVENEGLGFGSLGYSHLWIELLQVRRNNMSFAINIPNLKSLVWIFLPAWTVQVAANIWQPKSILQRVIARRSAITDMVRKTSQAAQGRQDQESHAGVVVTLPS